MAVRFLDRLPTAVLVVDFWKITVDRQYTVNLKSLHVRVKLAVH